MSMSVSKSGYQMMQQSSQMAQEAARDIQENSLPVAQDKDQGTELDFNKVDATSPPQQAEERSDVPQSYTDALVKLNQASQYSSVGANVLQRDQDMIGTRLDVHI